LSILPPLHDRGPVPRINRKHSFTTDHVLYLADMYGRYCKVYLSLIVFSSRLLSRVFSSVPDLLRRSLLLAHVSFCRAVENSGMPLLFQSRINLKAVLVSRSCWLLPFKPEQRYHSPKVMYTKAKLPVTSLLSHQTHFAQRPLPLHASINHVTSEFSPAVTRGIPNDSEHDGGDERV